MLCYKLHVTHNSMLVPTKATVKLANLNTVHSQGVCTILCSFPTFTIIYSVGPVYYCSCHLSNTILLGALKFYVSFQNITSEPLEKHYFVDPQGHSWISSY